MDTPRLRFRPCDSPHCPVCRPALHAADRQRDAAARAAAGVAR